MHFSFYVELIYLDLWSSSLFWRRSAFSAAFSNPLTSFNLFYNCNLGVYFIQNTFRNNKTTANGIFHFQNFFETWLSGTASHHEYTYTLHLFLSNPMSTADFWLLYSLLTRTVTSSVTERVCWFFLIRKRFLSRLPVSNTLLDGPHNVHQYIINVSPSFYLYVCLFLVPVQVCRQRQNRLCLRTCHRCVLVCVPTLHVFYKTFLQKPLPFHLPRITLGQTHSLYLSI